MKTISYILDDRSKSSWLFSHVIYSACIGPGQSLFGRSCPEGSNIPQLQIHRLRMLNEAKGVVEVFEWADELPTCEPVEDGFSFSCSVKIPQEDDPFGHATASSALADNSGGDPLAVNIEHLSLSVGKREGNTYSQGFHSFIAYNGSVVQNEPMRWNSGYDPTTWGLDVDLDSLRRRGRLVASRPAPLLLPPIPSSIGN